MTEPTSHTVSLLGMFRRALAANLRAAVLLWFVGGAIVAGYYFLPTMRDAMEDLGTFKMRIGLPFAMVSTIIFAGLIPFALQGLMRGRSGRFSMSYLLFLIVFWAERGIEVELLYRGQAWMFGDNAQWTTVLAKVLVDMLGYAPLWGVPTMTLAFVWAHHQFRWGEFRERIRGPWFGRLVMPVMVSNWCVWVPAVTLVYMLPQPLQLPMQNIVVCMWVLILMFITHEQGEEARE